MLIELITTQLFSELRKNEFDILSCWIFQKDGNDTFMKDRLWESFCKVALYLNTEKPLLVIPISKRPSDGKIFQDCFFIRISDINEDTNTNKQVISELALQYFEGGVISDDVEEYKQLLSSMAEEVGLKVVGVYNAQFMESNQ